MACMTGSNEEGVMINGDISVKLHRNKLVNVSVPFNYLIGFMFQ